MRLQFPGLANVVRILEIVLGLGISWLFIIIYYYYYYYYYYYFLCDVFVASIVKGLSFHK